MEVDDYGKLEFLSTRVADEDRINAKEIETYEGRQVCLGDEIMLLHSDSGMYLKISNDKTAKVNKTCNQVSVEHDGEGAVFTIMPKMRYRSVGELISYGDMIILSQAGQLNL